MRALYWLAMTKPYAPALMTASRSPAFVSGGNGRSFARKSPDSQTGPTMSWSGSSGSVPIGGGGVPTTGQIRWWEPYRLGRIRSFMPASTITNRLSPDTLR